MKCVITGTDTLNKTNNIPVSKEAREIVTTLTTNVNSRIKAEIVEKAKEEAEKNGSIFEEAAFSKIVEKSVAKLGKARILKSLLAGDKVVTEELEKLTQARGE